MALFSSSRRRRQDWLFCLVCATLLLVVLNPLFVAHFYLVPSSQLSSSSSSFDDLNHNRLDVVLQAYRTTTKLVEVPSNHNQTTTTALCQIARAMQKRPMKIRHHHPIVATYLDRKHSVPHLSERYCPDRDDPSSSSAAADLSFQKEDNDNKRKPVQAVFVFKAARIGSTFFTTVLTNTVKRTQRPVSMFWEPLGAPGCQGPSRSANYTQTMLHKVLTQQCTWRSAHDKCVARDCRALESNEAGPPIYITAANPRYFTGGLDWPTVFDRLQNQVRIFALRRTNLVLMAYSKFHHQRKCTLTREGNRNRKLSIMSLNRNKSEEKGFDLSNLLQCAQHFALGVQELSSSVAVEAVSAATGEAAAEPFVVAYEDVLQNGPLVQQGIVRYLGLQDNDDDDENGTTAAPFTNFTTGNMFQDQAGETNKTHHRPFCSYVDVKCNILQTQLRQGYPCLYQQLVRASEGLTWSVPRLPDGTISLRGDCRALEPLNESRPVRSLRELYQS